VSVSSGPPSWLFSRSSSVRFGLIALFIWALSASLSRAADPATTLPGGEAVIINGKLTRTVATCRWEDLLRLRISSGRLLIDPTPTAPMQKVLSAQPVAVRIEGSPDPWLVMAQAMAQSAVRSGGWTLSAAAQPIPGPDIPDFRPRIVSARPEGFHVIGEGRVHDRTMRAEFYVIGSDRVQLTFVDRTARNKRPTVLQAASLAEFLVEHPLEVRQYVSPLLDALSGRHLLAPGDVDVYRVFSDVQPDQETVASVEKIIADLGNVDVARRDAASAQLDELGAPAVLALLRRAPGGLSPEQSARVNRFLAAHTVGVDPHEAGKDAMFLIDCLDHEDRRIRVAAREALARLDRGPVDFDVDLAPADRRLAISRLLAEFSAATTQP
jgi:hypothetical protein